MGEYYFMNPGPNYFTGRNFILLPSFTTAITQGLPYKDWRPGMPLPDPSEDLGQVITKLAGVFSGLRTKKLDLSLWNTASVLTAERMFENSEIKELDLSMLNFNNCKTFDNMLRGCHGLKVLDFSNNSFPAMESCSEWMPMSLKILDISGWTDSLLKPNDDYDKRFLSPYAIHNLEHLFVNNNQQKLEVMRRYGMKESRVHVMYPDIFMR